VAKRRFDVSKNKTVKRHNEAMLIFVSVEELLHKINDDFYFSQLNNLLSSKTWFCLSCGGCGIDLDFEATCVLCARLTHLILRI